jgi:hypothetical protein
MKNNGGSLTHFGEIQDLVADRMLTVTAIWWISRAADRAGWAHQRRGRHGARAEGVFGQLTLMKKSANLCDSVSLGLRETSLSLFNVTFTQSLSPQRSASLIPYIAREWGGDTIKQMR